MKPELEALVCALEAVIESRGGNDAKRLDQAYQALLERTLQEHPNLSRETLIKMVDFPHRRWRQAQRRPPSLLPRA